MSNNKKLTNNRIHSVIRSLYNYKIIFSAYPRTASAFSALVRDNTEYSKLFSEFDKNIKDYGESLQRPLQELYGRHSSDPTAIANYLARNPPLLDFLEKKLPQFKDISEQWEIEQTKRSKERKERFDDKIAQYPRKNKDFYNNNNKLQAMIASILTAYTKSNPQKAPFSIEIPDSLLKHRLTRNLIIHLVTSLVQTKQDNPKYKHYAELLIRILNETETRILNGLDLKESQLSSCNFDGLWMRETDFSHSNLSSISAFKTNLFQAKFIAANLSGAKIKEATLCYANLRKANLSRANFYKSDLHNADLKEATLSNADFTEANLSRANFYKADLHNADLKEANLSNANLTEANLSGANFHKADLHDADLREANLSNAKLTEANLNYVNWGGAIFSNNTELDWNKYGVDIILSQLKGIGQSDKLSLPQKKAEAKKVISDLLPKITSNKGLIPLVEIINRKHSDYAYLREEQARWRLNRHGNTATWSIIIAAIKTRLDDNVDLCKKETYSSEEFQSFSKIMNEHRGRGLGPVTHSKLYKQISEHGETELESITIIKKT